jgi:hypothetical protein
MQDQPSSSGVAQGCARVERVVLALLLDPHCPGPWSVAELGRELGCELAAADAVVGLHATGLVHRVHELVFVTRAAARFHQLTGV